MNENNEMLINGEENINPEETEVDATIEDKAPVKKKSGKNLMIAGVIMICLVVIEIVGFQYFVNGSKLPKELVTSEPAVTKIDLNTSFGYMMAIPNKVAVTMRTHDIEIDLADCNYIGGFDALEDNFYILLGSDDGKEENIYFIGNELINPSDNITKSDIAELVNTVEPLEKEHSEVIENISFEEKASSMYKEGFWYSTWMHDETLTERRQPNLIDRIRYTKDTEHDIILNFAGIGEKNLRDLDIFKGKPGVMFDAKTGLFHIYDSEVGTTIAYISSLGNAMLNNDPQKLIPIEGKNNVYVDFGWYSIADWGYGGFAIMTEYGMYYFKITENMENPEEVATKIIEWLGIDYNAEVIDTGINFILTTDDMREPYVEEESDTESTDSQN